MTATPKLSALRLAPLPHQERVADKLEDNDGVVAYHGLGSGKTLTAINAADRLDLPLLAVVPAALRNNIHKEVDKAGFRGEHMVLSYEQAKKLQDDPEFREFASKALVAVDESHRAGRPESQRSQLIQSLPGRKKLLLTGTPIRNAPHEIAPLINAVAPGTLPDTEKGFNERFLAVREVPVGFFGRLRGAKPGKTHHPTNLRDFRRAVSGKVDFHQSVDRSEFPSHQEDIIEVPMTDRQQATYDFVMGRYPALAYKVRHGLPLNKTEQKNFRAFMSGPRQVVNHPGNYNVRATDDDAPKIRRAADEIHKRHAADPNFRGVAYSAFLDTGVKPLSRELTRRGIRHAVFTGEQGDVERKQIIEDYNTGKTPVLLLSGAGAEGLDLKGTKLMQILEPHWQEEQIGQVRGRAIRYKSHAHLPEHERHVEVQRFHAVPKAGLIDRMLGRSRGRDRSVDEYLYDLGQRKREINEPFLSALRDAGSEHDKTSSAITGRPIVTGSGTEWHCWKPDPSLRSPAFLFDLDDTLVTTRGATHPSGPGQQQVLPGRLRVLAELKAKGYQLIGITNRADYLQAETLQTVIDTVAEADRLLEGMLDDILFVPYAVDGLLKPSPVMIDTAIARFHLDRENCVFVGDSDADREAAAAAGVAYASPTEFFQLRDFTFLPPATDRRIGEPAAGWTEYDGRLYAVFSFPEDTRLARDFVTAVQHEAELRPGVLCYVGPTEPGAVEVEVTSDAKGEGFTHWISAAAAHRDFSAWTDGPDTERYMLPRAANPNLPAEPAVPDTELVPKKAKPTSLTEAVTRFRDLDVKVGEWVSPAVRDAHVAKHSREYADHPEVYLQLEQRLAERPEDRMIQANRRCREDGTCTTAFFTLDHGGTTFVKTDDGKTVSIYRTRSPKYPPLQAAPR